MKYDTLDFFTNWIASIAIIINLYFSIFYEDNLSLFFLILWSVILGSVIGFNINNEVKR